MTRRMAAVTVTLAAALGAGVAVAVEAVARRARVAADELADVWPEGWLR